MSQQIEHMHLQGARAGDREAFDALRAALEPHVRRFVRRLIGGSSAEDDIVQNTFVALYMNLDRLDDSARLRPFVFRVARNQCYDELRRQGRYDVYSLEDDTTEVEERAVVVADPQPAPDETAHWLLLYAEVQTAIERLPELQRQTLLLYTVENLSYAEIADTMGVSIGTVKSRLHHAKRNLAGLLHPDTLEALGVGGQEDESSDAPRA